MVPMNFEPFAVEQWMDDYETTAKFNIAETCAASISLEDLQALSDDKSSTIFTNTTKLTYGSIRGSEKLRSTLASLYSSRVPSPLRADDVLITPGAIAANFLVFYAFIGKEDHVICHYPTYQQLYSVPRSLGADVSLWKANEDDKWQLDIDELKGLVRSSTKMIVINNPNNPTGVAIPKSQLREIVKIAKENDLILVSDEAYRPLFHSIGPMDPEFPPSILSMGYPKAIATGTMSKAYALAGIRVGWIASRWHEGIESCAKVRHYTTISVSQIDDQIASYALSSDRIHNLLGRNIKLAKTNLEILERFVEQHRWACEWTKPVSGTTAFVKFSNTGKEVDDVAFCKLLHDHAGVLFVPGSKCFGEGKDFKGYVRIGFVCETTVLTAGLKELEVFMKEKFRDVPLAE